jgi:outer membrane protein LpxR
MWDLLLSLALEPSLQPILTATPASVPLASGVVPSATLRLQRGSSFYLDEDNFQFASRTDQNYTLGTGLTWEGDERDALDSHPLLDAPLDGFEAGARWAARRLLGLHFQASPRPAHYARTLFATAFTPEHIERADIQYGDRPYAFLVGWTVRRTPDASHADRDRFAFWRSEATLGTIGSPIGEVVQRSIHSALRMLNGSAKPVDPAGWDHQILDSRLGVPTARYDLTRVGYRRWGGAPRVELMGDLGAELGYYTDAHSSLSAALGWSSAPLWSFDMHMAHPGLVAGTPERTRGHEAFVFASLEGFAYAYNALLQGYGDWRSDYRFSRREIETFTYELRQGIVLGHWSVDAASGRRRQLRFVLEPYAFRSREFKGPLARGHAWGGVRVVTSETFALAPR